MKNTPDVTRIVRFLLEEGHQVRTAADGATGQHVRVRDDELL